MNKKEAVRVSRNLRKFYDSEIKPVKLGNKNKSGKCGMCGTKVEKLYPRKVGSVEFMICENCKSIMEM